MFKSKIYLIIAILGILALVAGACTPASPTTHTEPTKPIAPTTPTEPNQEDINFRFLISDDVNAIDDFASVNVTISKIGVQSGGESGNWTEFTPDITEVDLKPLAGENALEIYSGNLTPGEYSKVFIYVSAVNGILTSELGGERANVKLPSEKLQISKPFVISEDTATSFVYDITVIKAGQSGQYILKPQIAQSGADQEFTGVEQGEGKGEKPDKPGKSEDLEFEGMIESIDGTNWTVNIEGESRTVDISKAEMEGEPDVGLEVEIEGIEEDGTIIANEVEVKESEEQEEEEEEEDVELEGTITAIDGDTWTVMVDDEEYTVDVSQAEIEVEPDVGLNVNIKGVEEDGTIIAEEVEIEEGD